MVSQESHGVSNSNSIVCLTVYSAWLQWKYQSFAWPNFGVALQWRHNGRDGGSNHQSHDCLLNRLFRRRSKKTSKLRVTGHLCGEFTGHAKNFSIWWCHHALQWKHQTFALPNICLGIHQWCMDSPHKGPVMWKVHYDDVTMGAKASQITSLTIVYPTFYSDADQSKHQSSASLAFVWGIHRDRWIPRTKGQ